MCQECHNQGMVPLYHDGRKWLWVACPGCAPIRAKNGPLRGDGGERGTLTHNDPDGASWGENMGGQSGMDHATIPVPEPGRLETGE